MCKFTSFLAKISRWLLPALPVIGAFAFMAIFAEPALAAEVSDFSKWTGPLAVIVSGVIMIIVLFAFIFALFLGDLMDSTYIFDSGMGDTLHLIWEVMRNFVNVGFILILLVIAVMVIFGGGGERGLGLLKKVLPKFVLALILVNFTFFAARFVLTVNDVLATAIFSLPRAVSGEQQVRMPCDPNHAEGLSCLDQIRTTMEGAANKNEATSEKIEAIVAAISKEDRWFPQTVRQLSLGKKNMSLVLLSSMIDLEHIVHTKGVAGDGADLVIATIGTLIVAGAVGIIFFMLFLAFVVRMVVLWVAIAVSPLVALGIVLKELIPGFDMGKSGFDPVKIFVGHAFMPTMVAIPLSIGMIMIFANNAVGYDISTGWIETFSNKSGDIHALLWWVASIVVVWFGTNKMIKEASPEFAAKLTDGIHGGVNKFVGGTAGLLKYAPVIPAWQGGGKMSLTDMKSLPSLASSKMQAHTQQARTGSSEVLAEAAGGWAGYKPTPPTNEKLKRSVREWAAKPGAEKHQGNLRTEVLNLQQLGGSDFKVDETLRSQIKQIHPEANLGDKNKMSEILQELHAHHRDKGYDIIAERLIENGQAVEASAEEARMSAEKLIGAAAERGGEKIADKDTDRVDKKDYVINGQVMHKIKYEKTGEIVFATQNRETKEYEVQVGARDFDNIIITIEDKDGVEAAAKLDQLAKSKELLSEKQKGAIKAGVEHMIANGTISVGQVNNIENAVKKFFDESDSVEKKIRDELLKKLGDYEPKNK